MDPIARSSRFRGELAPGSVIAQTLALWGIAVAQPLYDLLARSPEFLVAHGVVPAQLLGLALVVSVVIPGLLVALVLLAGKISPLAGSLLHAGVIWLGVSAFALQLMGRVELLDSWLGTTLAAAVGSAALACYLRWQGARSFATLLVVGAVAFPLLLVWRAPVGKLTAP